VPSLSASPAVLGSPCLGCIVAYELSPLQLTRTWVADTQWTQRSSPAMRRAFGLRHRMLTFIQTLQTYTMVEVLEPHWHHFHANLDQVYDCGKQRANRHGN